jgi:hypothetical protein
MSGEAPKVSPSGKYTPVGSCEHCGKEYFSRVALAKHIRVKHEKGGK